MSDNKKRIEENASKKLSVLAAHGFSQPISKCDQWNTTISCLASDIAIEVELDWRDLDVFVLVTALSGSQLPDGYYVSNGKKRRIHLESILKNSCGVSDADIRNSVSLQPTRAKRNEDTMERRLDEYMQLLGRYILTIQERGLVLFEK